MVVSSADVAKEVMKTHDAELANRPKLMVGRELYYDHSDIGLAPYGEYWRQVRKIATLELFTIQRVNSFRPIREEEVGLMIQSIASEASGGASVNISNKLFHLAFDLTTRAVFNQKGKDQEAFKALYSDMTKVLSGFAIEDLYPSLKLLHSVGGMKRKLKQMVEESNRILDPIIDEHKSNVGRQSKQEEDLVDVLLKFHKDDPNDTEFSLTTNNIKAIILEIFGAGSDTSSTTVEWAMSELLRNPKAMEKAQYEVRQIYQGKETVDETNLDKLKFLKQVIKETLRLHPPAPLMVPRESIESCNIYGYDIPPKTRVIVNARAIGRDPKCWPEPDIFYPERFESTSIDYKGTHFELIPFGAGRRMCPAMTLGLANVELPLAMLLYHFNWELCGGIKPEDLDMDEVFGITVRRKNELHVIPIPYTSSSLTE